MNNVLRLSLGLLGLALAAYVGYDMRRCLALEQLWGYRPLYLYLGAYAALLCLPWRWWLRSARRDELLGLAVLSGVLLALGFPPSPVPLPMFFGFVPLLWAERRLFEAEGLRRGAVFRLAFLAFFLWNILTTYWVTNTSFLPGIFATVANALLMSIPVVLFHQSRRALRPGLSYAALAAFWICFEYIHLNWELTWPWLTLGNAFARSYALVQWYEYTGVFGGTLWILAGNLMIFNILWAQRVEKKRVARRWLGVALLLLLPSLLSWWMYAGYAEKGRSVDVSIVQPNFEPHYDKFSASRSAVVERFRRLSWQGTDAQSDYLIFPETVFGGVDSQRILANPYLAAMRPILDSFPQLQLVTGVSAYKVFGPGEAHTRHTRSEALPNGQMMHWEGYNAALQLSGSDSVVQFYKKSKLVPGAEQLPYKEALFMFKPLVDMLGGSMAGLGTQPERSVFGGGKARVAPIICYESVFGEYVATYLYKGANLLVIMTNDGWWDDTAGHRQHLYFASLRAIETRRSIARAANTGISALINQRGDVLQSLSYGQEGVLRGSLRLNEAPTFYARWRDLIARIALFVGGLLLLNVLVKSLLPRA